MSRLVVASNIRIETHLCDVVCDNPECDYSATDLNVNAETTIFKYTVNPLSSVMSLCPDRTVADYASLPDPADQILGTIYHVASVDNACNLYEVVDNSGYEWFAMNPLLMIQCPLCDMRSGYPINDAGDADAIALGRAKTSCV